MNKLFLSFFFTALLTSALSADLFPYEDGGLDWSGLCATGKNQSPINICPKSTVCDDAQIFDLYFTPGNHAFTVIDTGETLKATTNYSSLHATGVDDILTDYSAQQFHFHAPSEHTINGKHMDLEMHFLYGITQESAEKNETKEVLAVAAIFFEVDDDAEPNQFIEEMKFEEIDYNNETRIIDLNKVLRSQISTPIQYYTYQGSLTTLPCNETVNWYVLATPLKLKSCQLHQFTERYAGNSTFAYGHGNDRTVRPLDGRVVKKGGFSECAQSAPSTSVSVTKKSWYHKTTRVRRGSASSNN